MPRHPRFVLVGHPQHVIIRGNNREPIFYADEDYLFYLAKLQKENKKHLCDIHAYVLMTNHVHLLITPHKKDGISKTMQMTGRYYVQYFNHTYQRTGTLWEGRYKATLIDSEQYALTCYRYIEMNPVRAEMVSHPAEYPWSSYRMNALEKHDTMITLHPLYQELADIPEKRQTIYRALFDQHLDETSLKEIREATNKAWVLGSAHFKEQIAAKINRQMTPKQKGGDRKSEKYRQKKQSSLTLSIYASSQPPHPHPSRPNPH